MTKSISDENYNIKVNDDGTISPIDPTKPSGFTTGKSISDEKGLEK